MKIIKLDFSDIYTKEALFQYLQEVLQFPDFFGCNLDALYDCLTENLDVQVSLSNFDFLKEHLGEYADSVKQVFRDAGALDE